MKLSSRNLILLLLTVPASGLDMSSSAEKFREVLSQINNNSNIKDHALSFSSTVRGALEDTQGNASPMEKFSACGGATEKIDLDDFDGMDDMEKHFETGGCTMDMTDGLVISCDLKEFGKDYKKYARKCKKLDGQVVDISKEICMSPETMGDMMSRKLQESGENMEIGEIKVVMKDFPMCFAKQCNDESKAIMEGMMTGVMDMMGMSCPKENPKAKFLFKKKKNGDIKMMTCGKLATKNEKFIKRVCFSKKFQDYSSSALPASQVCGVTCKPDLMTTVDEVPGAKFSVMKDNEEDVMTCGELEKMTMTKDMKSGMEAMWTCIEGFKDQAPAPSKKKGGKKAMKKKVYGGAHKVCTETCGGVVGSMMGGVVGEE